MQGAHGGRKNWKKVFFKSGLEKLENIRTLQQLTLEKLEKYF